MECIRPFFVFHFIYFWFYSAISINAFFILIYWVFYFIYFLKLLNFTLKWIIILNFFYIIILFVWFLCILFKYILVFHFIFNQILWFIQSLLFFNKFFLNRISVQLLLILLFLIYLVLLIWFKTFFL